MISVRVDDFPNTKGEPQHTLAAFREFHKTLTESIGGKRYLLGVIPRRCDPDDLLFLRNETDCVIGMHGIYHDERKLDQFQNEFPSFFSQREVYDRLVETANALEDAVGRRVEIYMPPRNKIDRRTAEIMLDAGFVAYTTGPETPEDLRKHDEVIVLHSEPPHEYGRTDEMLQRNSHEVLRNMRGRDCILTLHWTWEVNVGLHHMREFFSRIPKDLFEDFGT